MMERDVCPECGAKLAAVGGDGTRMLPGGAVTYTRPPAINVWIGESITREAWLGQEDPLTTAIQPPEESA